MAEVKIRDQLGTEIQVGDYISRATSSSFALHRVLKINKRSLVVTAKYVPSNWGDYTISAQRIEDLFSGDYESDKRVPVYPIRETGIVPGILIINKLVHNA